LQAGGIVIEESFDTLCEREKSSIASDGGAEFTGFDHDGRFFG
jgi:hypothetical protein